MISHILNEYFIVQTVLDSPRNIGGPSELPRTGQRSGFRFGWTFRTYACRATVRLQIYTGGPPELTSAGQRSGFRFILADLPNLRVPGSGPASDLYWWTSRTYACRATVRLQIYIGGPCELTRAGQRSGFKFSALETEESLTGSTKASPGKSCCMLDR